MRGESVLVNQIRELMEPSNPVPATTDQDEAPYQAEIAAVLTELRHAPPELTEAELAGLERDRPGRRRGRDAAWRILAPVLSGLAVIAVITSLMVVAGPGPSRSKGGPPVPSATSLPPFYVTVNGFPPHQDLIVHSTKTGQTLVTDRLGSRPDAFVTVAATRSHRVFYLVVTASSHHPLTLYRMTLSKNGRLASLRALPRKLMAQFDQNQVTGMAVSPDGRWLAAAMQGSQRESAQRGIMAVVPLDGKGSTRVWSAPSGESFAFDLVWTDSHDVTFLFQDLLSGPNPRNTPSRIELRQLDTTSPGSALLSARLLIGSHLGFLQSAFASPHGGPIFVGVFSDKPASGLNGIATDRLVEFSPDKRSFSVLGIHKMRYHTMKQQEKADLFFQVYGIDASGQNVLVSSPHFGVLRDHKFSPLPAGPGVLVDAAW
jgi:hypothetical protein